MENASQSSRWIVQSPRWIVTASGDAVNLDFTKRIYIWVDGFGAGRKYIVKAVVDGGAAADDWVILDIFQNIDDAKNYVLHLIGDD